MRVVFVTDYYPPQIGGGVEVVVSQVARRFASKGHEVLVVTLGRGHWPRIEEQDGVRIRRFSSIQLNRLVGLQLTVSIEAFWSMKATIKEFAPDAVSAHNLYFSTTPLALRAARDLAIPSALTLHVAGMEAFAGMKGAVAQLYEKLMARRLLTQPDALVAVSEAVAASVSGYTSKPVVVIPNGVDIGVFGPTDRREGRGVRMVFVGRLIANKGPHIALEAFSQVQGIIPDATLVVVGDGPMRRGLERYVRARGLQDRVTFLGMRSDVAEILRECDLFVRPSLVEGMPLTTLEAMATGLPVIVSDVGGTGEVVSDGVTGYVVPPGSSDAVAQAMVSLARNEEMRRRMGRSGCRYVRQGHSWDEIALANEKLLTSLGSMHRG